VTAQTFDHQARLRSFELTAETAALGPGSGVMAQRS
jgi:hypothetical protein